MRSRGARRLDGFGDLAFATRSGERGAAEEMTGSGSRAGIRRFGGRVWQRCRFGIG